MAEIETPAGPQPEVPAASGPARSKDEIALELMRFIALQTGYGRGSQPSSAGFSGKPSGRSVEEHTAALLELFQRCRKVVNE
jgi:hypothetical protein